jgi:hypothetical protein
LRDILVFLLGIQDHFEITERRLFVEVGSRCGAHGGILLDAWTPSRAGPHVWALAALHLRRSSSWSNG